VQDATAAPGGGEDEREPVRPAFYAMTPGGVRDYLTLLHPPYTAWHLSYVAIGAALAPEFSWSRLVALLAGFGLAVGVGAHALDELHGRPLQTTIPRRSLVVMAAASIGAAVCLGVIGAATTTVWLLPFVAAGAFILLAYNLELFDGRFHSDNWFALAWGAFPLITGYFVTAETVRPVTVLAAVYAYLLSLAQRRLSTHARHIRRNVATVSGTIQHHDGTIEPITPVSLIEAEEASLRILAASAVTLAAVLIALRVE
jgi:hypothetical protein